MEQEYITETSEIILELRNRFGIGAMPILVYLTYIETVYPSNLTQTQIAEALNITRTTVKSAIDELALVGLVKIKKEKKRINTIKFLHFK